MCLEATRVCLNLPGSNDNSLHRARYFLAPSCVDARKLTPPAIETEDIMADDKDSWRNKEEEDEEEELDASVGTLPICVCQS